RPLLVVELVLGVGAVGLRLERRGFEEPRVARAAYDPGELAGDDAAGVVDALLGQHDRRRQVVPRGGHGAGDRGDARVVSRLRGAGVEPGRQVAAAGQHDVVAGRVVVRAVRE